MLSYRPYSKLLVMMGDDAKCQPVPRASPRTENWWTCCGRTSGALSGLMKRDEEEMLTNRKCCDGEVINAVR